MVWPLSDGLVVGPPLAADGEAVSPAVARVGPGTTSGSVGAADGIAFGGVVGTGPSPPNDGAQAATSQSVATARAIVRPSVPARRTGGRTFIRWAPERMVRWIHPRPCRLRPDRRRVTVVSRAGGGASQGRRRLGSVRQGCRPAARRARGRSRGRGRCRRGG